MNDGNEKLSCMSGDAKINYIRDQHDFEVRSNKELRKDLDVQLQKLKGLPRTRERELSVTKLQEAIMWLGMDLGRLREDYPYPESYNPDSKDIAPKADGLIL